METPVDPTKTATRSGPGVHLCSRCGWAFPNAHPSARHRRRHRRVCGTVEGYTLVENSAASTLSHSHSQHSTVSSFSDDEHGSESDGDSKAPSVIIRSVGQDGSGRFLEKRNMSADDVFADAVSEFADANASLAGEEGLSANMETVTHEWSGIPGFALPVEDVAVTGGIAQGSINHENSNESLQEGTTASPNQEQVTSFPEIPANIDDAMTDGPETGLKKIYDASVSKDANESSKAVTEEERTSKDCTVAETEISQTEEEHDVKTSSKTFMEDHFRESETIVRFKVEDLPLINFDELSTELAAEGSASAAPVISEVVDVPSITESNNVMLGNNQAVESTREIEEDNSYSLSVDDTGPLHSAAEIETLETLLPLTGSGRGSNDSNEKYINRLSRASASEDTRAISTTDKNGQEGSFVGISNIIYPDGGFEGIVAEDLVAKVEGNISENKTKSDNLINSEESASMPPVVLVQSAETISESMHTDRSVQLSSYVNSSLGDKFIDNTTGVRKEVKLDDVEASNPANDVKPVSHNVLLQKLEEDLSDDEPIESFPATESSSQSLGNNQVDEGGVFCKDSSTKDVGQSQDPEKGSAISVAGAPYEISSPNGSSLDGNGGSVSVLSTMSDAAGDVKKTKEAQEGQSDDKHDLFDPPSFLTLIEPQAQKASAASSTSGEVQNPQQIEAAWFPSISNVPSDSHGRKKNEEIITKVTNWSTGKQHSPLKTLLGEAKANSPYSKPSATIPKDKTAERNGTPAVPTVNSILGSEEPDPSKDKLDSSSKDWSMPGGYPDEIKHEKRKTKGRPYWVPFMCCASVSSVK